MGKYENDSVSNKPTKTTHQFFQDHGHSSRLIIRLQLTIGAHGGGGGHLGSNRSNEITIRFSPISHNRMEIKTRMVPNGLARRAASDDMHYAYWPTWVKIWLWPDLGLTWPEVKYWNWPCKVRKNIFRIGSTRRTRWCPFIFVSLISAKLLMSHEKWNCLMKVMKFHLRENDYFSFDGLCSQTQRT